MKTAAVKKLKQKLAAGDPVYGMWVTLESPSIAEMAAAIGLDWVVIDAEHGHLDWKEILEHVRATVRSETVALVRIADRNINLVKRALDIGADGILVPWIETAEQLRELVSFAQYPPFGVRGIGGERATAWGQCIPAHIAEANEHALVVPMIESVRGGQNIGEMLAVDGVSLFFFGPSDYSSSAGYAGQWEGPGVAEQLLAIKNSIVQAGKYCGIASTSEENLIERREQGFQMLGIGSDCGFVLRGLHTMLAKVGRDRKLNTALTPAAAVLDQTPLDRPPESFRPDRMEIITQFGSGPRMDIQPGVVFECLVGAPMRARNLTTGIVRFSPAVKLAYHRHPTTESITLLEGEALVDVEGRRYCLNRFDNVVIPAGVPHGVENLSCEREALLHVTFPTDAPSREILEPIFPPRPMPDNSTGPSVPGLERVNRFASAARFDAGQGATFIDYFKETLMPGIEMSGGYGEFRPGGRLPAHIHDFDESICIVDGAATCVVEGRRYSMSGYATALEPRGRVHYFINESDQPMAMIWVYAGPDPRRIVVDEQCATADGNPWKE
jgi:2-keto-3-deoxy-L-rhamnonate aldolase RhmA/quercetin dioxygenase-like cupin family protein